MAIYVLNENESELELLWRVVADKEKNGWTWDHVCAEMNEITGKTKSESSWRKKWAAMNKVVNKETTEETSEKKSPIINHEKDLESGIESEIRRLEIAKIQMRDERNAWQKQNYNTARAEQKLDYLESQLLQMGKINFEPFAEPLRNTENEMIILLSDWHIGQCFDSFIGKYNSDIAKKRIAQLLERVKENAALYDTNKAHILVCGDMISGSIHHTVQVTNRENVIEQIKIATELISSFCYECCKTFGVVQFYNVSGNHSRLTKKEDAIHDERLDDIIGWAVELSLNHIENFHYMKHRNLDSGIADISVCGNFYTLVHGDFDPATKTGTSDLSMMLGYCPTAIFRGHLHTSSFNEYNGVKVIQGGSLAGSGDQYTLEKRLFGKASQTICVCNKKGIKAHIPVQLD